MAVDVITLVAFIYEAGANLVEQCKLVKQHPTESSRIAVRCLNILGVLKSTQQEYTNSIQLQTSLFELRDLLERVSDLQESFQRRSTGVTV